MTSYTGRRYVLAGRGTTSPPVVTNSDIGRKWLVGTSATGDWSGWDGNVAELAAVSGGDAWIEHPVLAGDEIVLESSAGTIEWWDGSAWTEQVNGPGSTTDNALVRWDGTGGVDVQDSGITVDDSDNVSGMGTLSCGAITTSGTVDGRDLATDGGELDDLIAGTFTNANHDHADTAGGGTLAASVLVSGTVATARLGSGTANSSTFLRGDQTYAAPPYPTLSKSFTVETPGGSEDLGLTFTNAAITITEIRAVLVGSSTPSVTWTIRHGTDRNATGAEVVTGGTTTTSTTTGSDVTSFNDATVVADSFLWLETTAQSGTVSSLQVTFFYTED